MAEQAGVKAASLQLDTGEVSSFASFVDEVRRVLGGWGAEHFDFLVNNAGTSHHAGIAEVTEEDFEGLFKVHVKGVFFLTQKLLPLLRDGGRIVNVSSGLTRIIYPGSAAYGAMKGAVEVLTKYMAKELGDRRIAVNVVAPGAVQTDFSGGMVQRQPGDQQACCRGDGARSPRLAGRHRPDDRLAAVRRQSMGQRPADRSLRWHDDLNFASGEMRSSDPPLLAAGDVEPLGRSGSSRLLLLLKCP